MSGASLHPARWLLPLVLWASGTLAAASLSPTAQEPSLEGRALSPQARFARIDSLEVLYEEAKGQARANLGYRLAQLYVCTDLAKHKRLALDYLDDALAEVPDFFEAAQLRASIAHGMRYTREAWKWLEELVELHPEDGRGHRLLGDFHFSEAKRVLDPVRFQRARDAFLRCVQVDSTQADAWYGLAACDVALEEFEELATIALRLSRFEQHRVASLFLAGAASAALGRERLADDQFRRALAEGPPQLLEVYQGGQGFLSDDNLPPELLQLVDPELVRAAMRKEDPNWTQDDAIDLSVALEDPAVRREVVQAYWLAANPWPSHVVNRRQLAYWQRLVEADVLFGDPRSGLRGWDTEMGQAIVRWGRPSFTIYEPPSTGVDLEHWYARGVRLTASESIPAQTALWVWTYRRDDSWFSLLFTDPTYQANWRAGSQTAVNMVSMSRIQPLTFFDAEEEPLFHLSVETCAFPRTPNTTIESYVEIQPAHPSTSAKDAGALEATVELAIYDGDQRLMEYVQRDLRAEHRRSQLHAALGAPPLAGPKDPLLCQIGASLAPGSYRLAVDVARPGAGHRAVEVTLRIPSPVPPGLLALSDLQLASAFCPVVSGSTVPREFVKYAQGVVPLPSGVFPREAATLYVYFEVHNLRVGTDGKTRFNVAYRVFRQPPGTNVRRGGHDLSPQILAAMEPVGLTYTEESTGVSAQNLVIKGGNVDIADLLPGRYVLLVEIEDLLAQATESRYVAFSKAQT